MKQIVVKFIFYMFTILFFIVLWKITGELWEAFIPWNYKTDLLGILVITPLLIVLSFILSSFAFKAIRGSK